MARPKTVSDEEILGTTLSLVAEFGASVTLAQVGKRVGLSPATVVQRFGSKRDLMLAVATYWADRASERPRDSAATSAIDTLLDTATSSAGLMRTPAQVANLTSSMHQDLADEEFRAVIADGIRRQREILVELLDEAVRRGDLRQCDTQSLALSIQVIGHGAMQAWSIEPDGELTDFMRERMKIVVDPLRV